MSSAHRVAANTGILYARMALTLFISLYSTRLVLAALGAKDFGLYNVVGGMIAMLGFLNGAMAVATQRFISFAQGAGAIDKVKRIFNMSVILHSCLAIIVVLILEIVGYVFFHGVLNIDQSRVPIAKIIFQFMAAGSFFTIISVPYEAVITSHENMLLYAVIGIVEALLKLCIALYLALCTLDRLVVYGLLMTLLSIFSLLIRRIYCHRKYPECKLSIFKSFDKGLLKEMTSFAGWSFLGLSTGMVANYGQGIVLNIFFGTVVNAAQGVAGQISGQLGVFATTLIKALNPVIDKSEGAGERQLMLSASMVGCKISFFLLVFLYITFLLEMPYILKGWLNTVPAFTVIFCRLLLLRNLIEQIVLPLNSSISAVGNIKKYQIVISIINIFPLLCSYLLFSLDYPPYFLYIMFLLYSFVSAIITIVFANKACGLIIGVFLRNVVARSLSVLIAAFLISAVPTFIVEPGLLQLFCVIIVSTVALGILIWFIGLNSVEKHGLKKMVHNLFPSISFIENVTSR